MGPLVKLQDKSTNAEVRTAAAGAVANLALDAQARLDILQCYGADVDHILYGGTKPLVLRLHDGDEMEKNPCAKALSRISAQALGCDALIGSGAIEHVLVLMTEEKINEAASAGVEEPAARLLQDAVAMTANCMTRPLPAPNDQVREAFVEGGGLVSTINVIKNESMHPKIVETTLYVIMQVKS